MICERVGIVRLRIHDLRYEGQPLGYQCLALLRIDATAVTGQKTLQIRKGYNHLQA